MSVEVVEKIGDEVPRAWQELGPKEMWVVFVNGNLAAVFFSGAQARRYAKSMEEALQQKLGNDYPSVPSSAPTMS